MVTKLWSQRHRQHNLASAERVGRYARNVAWDRFRTLFRTNWLIFLGLAILPLVFAVYAAFLLHGALRWGVVGASIISGPWLVAMIALLLSGAAPQLMGLQAEAWTAQEFRILRRKDWRLINGLQLRGEADIDHIVVGPSGLFVVETKWSAESWPTNDGGREFMDAFLKRTVTRTQKSLSNVNSRFRTTIADTPTRALCVLWSADSSPGKEKIWEFDGVTVVPGTALRRWIREQDQTFIGRDRVDEIMNEIEKVNSQRDRYFAAEGVVNRPTLSHILLNWILTPVLTAMAALSVALAATRFVGKWYGLLAVLAALLLIGVTGLRVKILNSAAWGWILGSTISAALLLVLILKVYS
jgi:hypothetical protein